MWGSWGARIWSCAFCGGSSSIEHSSEVVELMLMHCLRLCQSVKGLVFGLARAATLPLNLAEAWLNHSVSSIARESYESLCDTLQQPLTLIGFKRAVVAQHPLVVVQHSVADAYYLSMAFAGQCELLVLRVFTRYLLSFGLLRIPPPPWFDCFALWRGRVSGLWFPPEGVLCLWYYVALTGVGVRGRYFL
jgi:hypothetical protein